MMGTTYRKCARTVLWLGSDLVHAPVLGRHPTWHRLDELGMVFLDLTKRRYFSRVWVVQELVLSPKIIVSFENKVYWADASVSRYRFRIGEDYHDWLGVWNKTRAPWGQFMCQGYVSFVTCSFLILTPYSAAV